MRGRYASYWSYPIRNAALVQFGSNALSVAAARTGAARGGGERCHGLSNAPAWRVRSGAWGPRRGAPRKKNGAASAASPRRSGQSCCCCAATGARRSSRRSRTLAPRLAETRAIADGRCRVGRLVAPQRPAGAPGPKSALRHLAARSGKCTPAALRFGFPAP